MPDYGSVEFIRETIKRNQEIIANTEDWSLELQIRIDQTYVLEIMLDSLINKNL